MPQLQLIYFDFYGGGAGPDHRFSLPEFDKVCQSTPFGRVPTPRIEHDAKSRA